MRYAVIDCGHRKGSGKVSLFWLSESYATPKTGVNPLYTALESDFFVPNVLGMANDRTSTLFRWGGETLLSGPEYVNL